MEYCQRKRIRRDFPRGEERFRVNRGNYRDMIGGSGGDPVLWYNGNESSPSLARNVPWDFSTPSCFPLISAIQIILNRLLYSTLYCMHSVEWVD